MSAARALDLPPEAMAPALRDGCRNFPAFFEAVRIAAQQRTAPRAGYLNGHSRVRELVLRGLKRREKLLEIIHDSHDSGDVAPSHAASAFFKSDIGLSAPVSRTGRSAEPQIGLGK